MRCTHHVLILFGLLGLAVLVQVLVIGRAVVPSLDSVRYVKAAQAVEREGVLQAIRTDGQQPLFPVWVAVVHRAIVSWAGDVPSSWAVAVQTAAVVPLVLAVVPIYLLLIRLFRSGIAVVGSILFCALPEVRRLSADGLSDSLHLLFFTAALGAAVAYWTSLSRNRAWWLAAAGLLTGLALLARAEAIILPVAIVLSLVIAYVKKPSRLKNPSRDREGAVVAHDTPIPLPHGRGSDFEWTPRAAVVAVAGHGVGLLLVLVPYVLMAGDHTPGAAVARVLGRAAAEAPPPSNVQVAPLPNETPDGRPLRFLAKEGSIRRRGIAAAVGQYADELVVVFGYWAGVVALWTLWRRRRELARPVDRFMELFFVLFSITVIAFVSREGYLSARHLLPLLVTGLGVTAVGLCDIGTLLSMNRGRAPRLGVCAIMTLIIAVYLISATRPLRADRLAHRQAGAWLAQQSNKNTAVLDTRGWTALYSARPTYLYDKAKTALGDGRLGYIVIEPKELTFDTDRARTLGWLLETAGERAARFAGSGENSMDEVAVYRWRGERLHAGKKGISPICRNGPKGALHKLDLSPFFRALQAKGNQP